MAKNTLYYIISIIIGIAVGFFLMRYVKDEHFASEHMCILIFALTVIIFAVAGHFLSKNGDEERIPETAESEEPAIQETSRIYSGVWGWITPEEGGVKSGYPLSKDRVIIGRDVKCEIMVNDESISRQHAELLRTDDGYKLTDMNSKNGVYVNNQRVSSQFLQDGDRIMLGNRNFAVKIMIPIFTAEPSQIMPDSEAETAMLKPGDAIANIDMDSDE